MIKKLFKYLCILYYNILYNTILDINKLANIINMNFKIDNHL